MDETATLNDAAHFQGGLRRQLLNVDLSSGIENSLAASSLIAANAKNVPTVFSPCLRRVRNSVVPGEGGVRLPRRPLPLSRYVWLLPRGRDEA